MKKPVTPSLITLPSELLASIFERLFQETILAFGNFFPKQHRPLDVLLTCRQVYSETQSMVKRNITLYFASTNLMLGKLLPMSADQRSEFRRIRVRGYPLPFHHIDDPDGAYTTFPFATALDMLPGLQLDTLFVEDVYHDNDDGWGDGGAHCDVSSLICARGWRQLLFYTPTSGILIWRNSDPQKAISWQQQLNNEDGHSDGSVLLFKGAATDTFVPAVPLRIKALDMLSRDEWECFKQSPEIFMPSSEDGPILVQNVEALIPLREVKPILVFATRTGRFQQTGERCPKQVQEILDAFEGDWPRIRDESGLLLDAETDPNGHL
ncbi:hypothetical protein HWV62_9797 [Athelia sp. TMB]|nr:hypothetical protein HWV62_9797 [Athelia sp. TMB]